MAEPIGRAQVEPKAVGTVRGNARLFVNATLLVAAALVVASFVQVVVDGLMPGTSIGQAIRSPWTISAEELRPAISSFCRAFTQLITVVIMALAIAVPLTANMYTPKLLEIFLGDRLNRVVLGLILFSTVNVLWVTIRVQNGTVPRFGLVLTLVLLLACFSAILPYFFYVFRFLHPSHILERLQQSASRLIRRLPELAQHRKTAALQADVRERIEHITSLGMRSLDRADREVAQGALVSIQAVMQDYAGVKPELGERWFEPTFADAMRMSREAMAALEGDRTWVEMECLRQVELIFLGALKQAPDLVGATCQVLRDVGMRAVRDERMAVLDLTTDFLHSFIRATINRRDVRSAYHVLYQYRHLAEGLIETRPEAAGTRPEVVGTMARRLAYYADVAVQAGLNFVAETIAYDVGALAYRAHEAGSAAFDELLGALAGMPRASLARRPLNGVHKASIILAARLELAGAEKAAAPLPAPVKQLEAEVREALFSDLLDEPPERFWEVTDRLVNFDHTPPEVREQIARIKARLEAGD